MWGEEKLYSTAVVVQQWAITQCGATSVVLGSEFLTVLQRLQEPATSAWR